MATQEFDYLQPDYVSKMMARPDSRTVDEISRQFESAVKKRWGVYCRLQEIKKGYEGSFSWDQGNGEEYTVKATPELLQGTTHIMALRATDLAAKGYTECVRQLLDRYHLKRQPREFKFRFGTRDDK